MKVLLLNTDDYTGGAAIACRRLLKAIRQVTNVNAEMLVQKSKSGQEGVVQLNNTWFLKKLAWLRFILERVYFLFYEKNKDIRYSFNLSKFGLDITGNQLVKSTDVIHLHWINFGFLSIDSIGKLGATGKPIVWTLHDMWAFTGGCHHSGDCENYQNVCGNCTKFLRIPFENDLSNKIWQEKLDEFAKCKLTIVTCSNWLGKRAKKSSLFRNIRVETIPNPINVFQFKPKDSDIAKSKLILSSKKKYILFASMNLKAAGKGFSYFEEAINIFTNVNQNNLNNLELLIFGKANENDFKDLPLKVNFLGQLTDQEQIINAYNAASVFVIPSLEENLPNTIMEAMACGTPVVGFNVGGIPEMIVHKKTGYLANYKSAEDLAAGIKYVLEEADYQSLCENSRQKVVENYSEEVVAKQYVELYKSILDEA